MRPSSRSSSWKLGSAWKSQSISQLPPGLSFIVWKAVTVLELRGRHLLLLIGIIDRCPACLLACGSKFMSAVTLFYLRVVTWAHKWALPQLSAYPNLGFPVSLLPSCLPKPVNCDLTWPSSGRFLVAKYIKLKYRKNTRSKNSATRNFVIFTWTSE